VLVTTNFSITYFSVANEVEGSGLPAWLLVADAEGMSVLTAWAAGKFDAERIAKSIKTFDARNGLSCRGTSPSSLASWKPSCPIGKCG
jgi:acetyl-CoA decarbonylase/synthase complex subunit gamma